MICHGTSPLIVPPRVCKNKLFVNNSTQKLTICMFFAIIIYVIAHFTCRFAAALVACAASVMTMTACTSTPAPSRPPATSAPEPTFATPSPGPRATGEATYKPDGKPLVLHRLVGDVVDFSHDGDEWWCSPGGVANKVGNAAVPELGTTFFIAGGTIKFRTEVNKKAVTVRFSPRNPFYGGIVTRKDGSQLPFALPMIEGREDGYAPYFSLPVGDFSAVKKLTLCGEPL